MTVKVEKRICVDTPLGRLCACIGGDEINYPEIFVYIERQDMVEIDLVACEVKIEDEVACAYLYGDTSTDQWTRKHIWTKAEIDISEEN